MNKNFSFRLRAITFFQYVVICGVIPVMSLYLKEIPGISGVKVGIILSMSTAAGILSPLISVYIADRYISAEKLFSVCNIAASMLMTMLRQQSGFLPILFIYLFLMMCITPSTALINIMVFNFLKTEGFRFGSIRVWGTLGWIFMSLFFSYVWLGDIFFMDLEKSIGDILYFSSATALFLGLFSLTIHSEKKESKKSNAGLSLFGKDLSSPDRRRLYVFFMISFFMSIVDKYYYMGLSPYLRYAGISDKWIMPVISSGNISEIFLMFFLFRILVRFGFKKTLAAGAAAHCLRFFFFAFSDGIIPVLSAILIHGVTFALFSAAAYIYLDMYCSSKTRTSNHLVYSFVISGAGNLVGNLAAGNVFDISLSNFGSYSFFWFIPAIVSLISLFMIIIFIDNSKPVFQEKG